MIVAPDWEHIKALLFILSAYFLTCVVLYLGFKQFVYVRWTMASALVTAAAFLTGSPLVVLGIIVIIAWLAQASDKIDRLSLYLVLLPLLPVTWGILVPGVLPGINYLIDLGHPIYLSMLILFPLLLTTLVNRQGREVLHCRGRTGLLDALVFIYFLGVMIMSFQGTSMTGGLRFIVQMFFLIFLPYIIFSRFVKNLDDFFIVFRAFLFSSVLIACVAISSEYFSWNYYSILSDSMQLHHIFPTAALVRDGLLRVEVTMITPIALGYFLVIGLLAITIVSSWYEKRALLFSLLAILLLLALFFTVSRGPWLAAFVFVSLFYMLLQRHVQRTFFLLLLASVGIGLLAIALGVDAPHDEYGSVAFRTRLIEISLQVAAINPWFGSTEFYLNPLFDELRVDAGFIDIVNTYLYILLRYGVFVLILFSSILLCAFMQLLKQIRLLDRSEDTRIRRVGAGLAAIVAATMVILGTVSSVSFIPIYYWILIGLSVSFIRIADKHIKASPAVDVQRQNNG